MKTDKLAAGRKQFLALYVRPVKKNKPHQKSSLDILSRKKFQLNTHSTLKCKQSYDRYCPI